MKRYKIARIKYWKAIDLAFLVHIPKLLMEVSCQICSKERKRNYRP